MTILRPAAVTLAALLLGTAPAYAQGTGPVSTRPQTGGRTLARNAMHYGKWLTAAAAVGLTVMGAQEHHRSSREWDTLLGICRADNASCIVGSNGQYVSQTAEYHYQLALYYDRRANHRLLGGQLSLLATAAMFIVDRHVGHNGPDNIPFDPDKLSVAPNRWGGANLGLRFRF